jgi:excinuclease ABC subunit B
VIYSQQSKPFKVHSPYEPAGDQGRVIDTMIDSLKAGNTEQTILGVTGSGKTYMMAKIVESLQRPTIIMAHNKTLAAQLAEEFKRFFPDNAVHYFVSYYDYYQPESYIASSDTYIEKQTEINEDIERLRNAATMSLLTRRDTLIVASVSCIYGLGNPGDYMALSMEMKVGEHYKMDKLARRLIDLQFDRNDMQLNRGQFRIKGEALELVPAGEEYGYRFSFWGEVLEEISVYNLLTNETVGKLEEYKIFPASQYVTTQDKIRSSLGRIRDDMETQTKKFLEREKYIEAQRLRERVTNDLEMLETVGFVGGIENYSSYFDGRGDGMPPSTLLDYFPEDALLFVDESHITLPQIGGMYAGDRSRKTNLIDYGFRLSSALNNRPLKFHEWNDTISQKIYVSATPGPYELGQADLREKFVRAEFDAIKSSVLSVL